MRLYYKEKNISVYHGDCLKVMNSISDKSIDMVCCDLPYGITKCKWDTPLDLKILWKHYKRICKNNAAIILFGKQPFTTSLICAQKDMFKYCLIWEKDKPTNFFHANRQPMQYHEDITVFYSTQPIYNKQMVLREDNSNRCTRNMSQANRKLHGNNKIYAGKVKKNYDPKYKNPKSILYFNTGQRQKLQHPTQKPLALIEYLIKTYSDEGNIILDNCMGSGTVLIACKNLKRKGIGIEKEEKYCEITRERLSKKEECKIITKITVLNQQPLFGNES